MIYLACAPKSNAAYVAYNKARRYVAEDSSREVPVHLRNAPTRLMKELGYGHEYRYAHDEPEAYAAGETYLPEGMAEPDWYQPVPRGMEAKIAERLAWLKSLDAAAGRKKIIGSFHARHTTAARRCDRHCSQTQGPWLRTGCRGIQRARDERKTLQTRTQDLQARRNATSRQIGMAKSRGEDVAPIMAEAAGLGDELKANEAALAALQDKLNGLLMGIPNVPHESVPAGQGSDENFEASRWGEPRRLIFRSGTMWTWARDWGAWISMLRPSFPARGFRSCAGGLRACTARWRNSCWTCTRANTAIPRSMCPTS